MKPQFKVIEVKDEMPEKYRLITLPEALLYLDQIKPLVQYNTGVAFDKGYINYKETRQIDGQRHYMIESRQGNVYCLGRLVIKQTDDEEKLKVIGLTDRIPEGYRLARKEDVWDGMDLKNLDNQQKIALEDGYLTCNYIPTTIATMLHRTYHISKDDNSHCKRRLVVRGIAEVTKPYDLIIRPYNEGIPAGYRIISFEEVQTCLPDIQAILPRFYRVAFDQGTIRLLKESGTLEYQLQLLDLNRCEKRLLIQGQVEVFIIYILVNQPIILYLHIRYDGELIDNKKNGRGVYRYANGEIYDGEWKDDKKNGRGVYKQANGDMYDGEFKDDKRNGRGVQKWVNGDTYYGEWKDDNVNGRGVQKWVNGDTYDGEYKDNKRNGRGVYKWANGNMYDGEYKDDKRNGRGVFKWANGNMYDGEYKDNKRNGRGVYKWANGNMYDGEYKDNKRNGRGVYKWENGNMYDGEYKDDKRNGRGVFKWANGNMYDGDWLDDNGTGSGKLIYSNGNTEIGKWKDSLKQGDHEFYELKKISIITYKDNNEIKRQQI